MSKICFYLESYYVGGLDTFTIDLLNSWPNKKDDLFLIVNNSHTALDLYSQRLLNSKARLLTHNMPMVPDYLDRIKEFLGSGLIYKITSVILYYTLFFYYVLSSFKVLNLRKYDKLMIISGGYPAGPSCRAIAISWGRHTGKKSIYNFHNYSVKPKRIVYSLENYIDRLVCKHISYFVSVSNSCASSIRNRPSIYNFNNVKYILNGTNNQTVVANLNLKKELGIDENAKICLMLATYEKRKGHKFLFEAFRKVSDEISDSILICCGYGRHTELLAMKDLVEQFGLENRIFILNFRYDALEFLAQSDILLIASQSFESFGLTAVEAMKYKKPIVSTNVGGLSEVIIDNEGGYLFDISDVTGYANKIIELLKNPGLCQRQGELGFIRYVENFQLKRVALEYSDLFQK